MSSSLVVDMKSYAQTKISMLVFGLYMFLVGGIGFCFFPNTMSILIGLKAADGIYIRMFGLLAAVLAVNYFVMVQQTAIAFFKLSIAMRYVATLFMIYLVACGIAHQNLLLLAFVDTMTATWTLLALWYDNCWINIKRKQLQKSFENDSFHIKFVY
jgi:hypothetical protein